MDLKLKVATLQKELEVKESTLQLAAKYGKELLIQNEEFASKVEEQIKEHGNKIEIHEQENYTLKHRLEARENEIRNQANEIEMQERILNNKNTICIQGFEEKIEKLEKKVLCLHNRNENDHKELHEVREENSFLGGRLKEALENLSNREMSFNAGLEASLDQSSCNIQIQLTNLSAEKQMLETEILERKNEIACSKHQLLKAERTLNQLKDELESKECELTSQFNVLERSRAECTELRMEIDQLHLNEIDPNRKGNSLFSEVEDKRQILDKQVLSLASNNSILKKQNEMKSQQIIKMKIQMASILNFRNNESDSEYVQQLEENLYAAKAQLDESVQQYKELQKQMEDRENVESTPNTNSTKLDGANSLFKAMYQESQTKIEDLEKSLRHLRFEKISQGDKVLQLQKKVHRMEKEKEVLKAENIKIKVALEELKANKGVVDGTKVKVMKTIIEKIPLVKENKLEDSSSGDKKCPKEKFILTNSSNRESAAFEMNVKTELKFEDKENIPKVFDSNIGSALKQECKKVQKSVKMMDTVVVHDSDEKDSTTQVLKSESEEPKGSIRRKRQLKEMVAPHIIVDESSAEQNACNQQ